MIRTRPDLDVILRVRDGSGGQGELGARGGGARLPAALSAEVRHWACRSPPFLASRSSVRGAVWPWVEYATRVTQLGIHGGGLGHGSGSPRQGAERVRR